MSVLFPLFPSRFSLPSFPTRSSQWCLWLTRVPSSPSLCIPFPSSPFPLFPALFPYWRLCPRPLSLLTIMSPPSFPIDDYVPALFPYFRLCSFSLSLFSIMPWHSLSLMSLCYFYKIVESAILCSKYLSEQTGQLLFMHRICSIFSHYFWCRRALFENGCSSPLKIMGARAL